MMKDLYDFWIAVLRESIWIKSILLQRMREREREKKKERDYFD
jgi:hypothetical protein